MELRSIRPALVFLLQLKESGLSYLWGLVQ